YSLCAALVDPVPGSVQPDRLWLRPLRRPYGRQGEQERKQDDVCRKEHENHRDEEKRQVDRMPNVAIRSSFEEGPFFGEPAVDILPGQERPCGEQWQSDKQKDGTENLESHRERKGERPRLAIEDDARGDPVDRQADSKY